jgi:hypothetical protein
MRRGIGRWFARVKLSNATMTLHCFKSGAQTIAVLLIDSVSLSDSVELVVPDRFIALLFDFLMGRYVPSEQV